MKNYNTKQKDMILDMIKNKKYDFTIKEIYEELNQEVGLTTIYRLINKLVNDNILIKYINQDNITYYEYLGECSKDNHFYLKCTNCSKLIHIDCDCMKDLEYHIKNKHEFKVNPDNIIINGICKKCSRGE